MPSPHQKNKIKKSSPRSICTVIVKATKDSEQEGALPDPQIMADMNQFNDELLKAGVLLGYEGLHPSSKDARVHLH